MNKDEWLRAREPTFTIAESDDGRLSIIPDRDSPRDQSVVAFGLLRHEALEIVDELRSRKP